MPELEYALDIEGTIRATVDDQDCGLIWWGDQVIATFTWYAGKTIAHLKPALPMEIVVGLETALWVVAQRD